MKNNIFLLFFKYSNTFKNFGVNFNSQPATEKKMKGLKKLEILKTKTRCFFRYCIRKNIKNSKKATIKDWYCRCDASE
jgi:hypothetical protein